MDLTIKHDQKCGVIYQKSGSSQQKLGFNKKELGLKHQDLRPQQMWIENWQLLMDRKWMVF